jgi:hypothetical protein
MLLMGWPIDHRAGRGEEDEVVDVIEKSVRFKPQTLRRMANAKIKTISTFSNQVRIAYFESQVSCVWA